jgi:hypothetical protein
MHEKVQKISWCTSILAMRYGNPSLFLDYRIAW